MKLTEFKKLIREEVRKVLKEINVPTGNMTEDKFIEYIKSINPKAANEIQDINTRAYDRDDLYQEYSDVLIKYDIPVKIVDLKHNQYSGVKSIKLQSED